MSDKRTIQWVSLVANLGVLFGIVLVIVELNQNRQMVRAEIRHGLSMGIVDLLQTSAANEQLADVMRRAINGEELTPTETFQFQMRTNALFRYWEDVHYQMRLGLYDEHEFDRQVLAWKASIISSARTREYWCDVRQMYSQEFMEEMDGLLETKCPV